MNQYLQIEKWRLWLTAGFLIVLLSLGATGCASMADGIVNGMFDSLDDKIDHDAYKHYYTQAGLDNKTAEKKADAAVFWDNMSER